MILELWLRADLGKLVWADATTQVGAISSYNLKLI